MVNQTSENELLRWTEREKACVRVFERKSQCASMCASEIQRESMSLGLDRSCDL